MASAKVGGSNPDRVRIRETQVLSDNWGILTKYQFDYLRADGMVQTLTRETYDRGHGAVILLYNAENGTVVLTRQFRLVAHVNGHHEDLIEACAGLLDERDPETAIRHEAEEETGFRVGDVTKIWVVFMSPGSVTEKLHFFVAPYTTEMQAGTGGGVVAEGEDIAVMEVALSDALAMIDKGEIVDAKTIMLIQYAALKGLCVKRP
jgi:nudix-type nucleoside diphosphatase (YffH/AdpP family)